ncbi:pseudaminic acid cytidylyltransferase [Halomonas sp. BC04]|uniref:pseudaminic acid cytidylyltransferase n=1 Tax=Halomonas sp. BC04 TaxID=1403540 RepID=UPI0003ED67E0|nr:pseudaminic acid cytidylyltransferase [Halomonas sp. BC04]EWH00303.1 CMP-N-acetylneuraminic acid synthetase [Halomonas sp. BC04]
MNVAIIPARGGSKRIPHKNIKLFCGKPIIAWSIEAARASGCFDRIMVSTDDREIADVAREEGAEVPFMRPAELSNDHTGTMPVIAHAVQWLRDQGSLPDQVCCLHATAPFVQPGDLCRGRRALLDTGADFAFSVTNYVFPIQRAIRITPEGRVSMFQPEYFATRSQDLEDAWHDAGQFYWGRADAWCEGAILFSDAAVPVFLPTYRVQDIDTLEDWQRAEWLFRAMQAEISSK